MTRIGDMPRTPAPSSDIKHAQNDLNEALVLAGSMSGIGNELAHTFGADAAAKSARHASQDLASSCPDAAEHARKAAEAFDRASSLAFSQLEFNVAMLEGVGELNKAIKGAA